MKLKWTDDKIIKYIEDRGYVFIKFNEQNNEVGLMRRIIIRCDNLNHPSYETRFGNFKNRNTECPYCRNKDKKTFEFVYDEFKKEEYKVLTKKELYKNTKTRLKVLCPNNNIWETTYNRFSNGVRCSCEKCKNNRPLSYDFVKGYISAQGDKLLSTEYTNNRTQLMIKCKNGHIYNAKFNNYKDNGSRCPICNESKGERKIVEILNDNNIEYERQYKFDDCKFKRALPFDFYLPKYNCCIEFDGRQHFDKTVFHNDFWNFVDIKIRDFIKTDYCKRNNIKLIRIPYWDFNQIKQIFINEKIIKE